MTIFKTTAFSVLFLLLLGCESEIKKEDLLKKRDEVNENMTEAKENIKEAYEMKAKFLEQQKKNMISDLEEKRLQVELEIEKLQDMTEDTKNVADNEINSAIKKYQTEKSRLDQRIETIRDATDKNWMKVSDDFEKEIDEFQKSMDKFMVEVERLEALKADTVK